MRHLSLKPGGLTAVTLAAGLLAACGGSDDDEPTLPRLAAAQPAALSGTCEALAARLATLPDTTISATTTVAAGKAANVDAPEHCLVTGEMFRRTSAVDGKSYAIGFEMRLPVEWNGRFFYQANGGLDGAVVPAIGGIGGGAPVDSALRKGFAVISSDAGHAGALARASASIRRRGATTATTRSRSSRRWRAT